MNVIRLMLTELLLVLPMLIIGAAALAFLNRKKEKHQSCIAVAFLTGTGICMLCFAALVLVGALRETAFATVYRWYLAAFCLLILLSLTLILFAKVVRSYVIMRLKALRIKSRWPFYAALFLLYLTLAGTYFLHSPLLENRFDLPERLATMEETGLLCGTDPLTGELTGVSFSLESAGKAILPAWYLSCMKLTGIGRLDMLFVAAPLWVLLLCMAAYYEIGAGIFGRFDAGNRRSLLFLLFFTLVTLCGNAAYMNTSYGLLHYAYEETTLFASVLLPCVFAVLLTAGRNIGRRRR